MKTVIKYAMEFDLIYLEVKEGYNGAPLLNMIFSNKTDSSKVLDYVKPIAVDTNSYSYLKTNDFGLQTDEVHFKVSATFGKDTKDNVIYRLKI